MRTNTWSHEQKQPEGEAHLVPERAAGTEEGAHALKQAIDQLKDLRHEERQQDEHEEKRRPSPPIAKAVSGGRSAAAPSRLHVRSGGTALAPSSYGVR